MQPQRSSTAGFRCWLVQPLPVHGRLTFAAITFAVDLSVSEMSSPVLTEVTVTWCPLPGVYCRSFSDFGVVSSQPNQRLARRSWGDNTINNGS